MQHKIHELNETIKAKALELGLEFVSGPGTRPLPAIQSLAVSVGATNGQERAVYLFAVARAC
jgi:hypothetical protein